MKKLAYIFLIAIAATALAPAARAVELLSVCSCICTPQPEFITSTTTGPTGAPMYTPVPNTCTPPKEKQQLGTVKGADACRTGCKDKCSVMESCTAACSKDTDCEPGTICGAAGFCVGTSTASGTAAPTITTPTYKPIAPNLAINIPNLSLPDFLNVTRNGNYYYIPFISVYLSAAFRIGLGIAAVLAVIMIMIGGFIWIAAAGDSGKISTAKKMISGAVVGLLLTLGSYTFLQLVDPNLISLQALKIRIVQPEELDISEDQESDMIDASQFPTGPVAKPSWNAQTFLCPPQPAVQPPAGTANPQSLVKIDCPTGIVLGGSDSGGGRTTAEVRNALCAAGVTANAAGYVIKVNSTYRPFEKQASLWCGEGAAKYPDPATRKIYYAVPGYSSHGLGNAVDVMLIDKGTGKDLYSFSGKGQCNSNPANVAKIAGIMEGAGFVRYEAEIWHFEKGGPSLPLRGAYTGLPAKCGK